MKSTKHPNAGTSLEDFLKADGNYEAATAVAVKRVIAWQLQEAMAQRGMTKTSMAKQMETTRAQLDRVLNPEDENVTLVTLQRAAAAVGRKIKLELA